MAYSTIFFDLDGTLTDPGMGITNSILYALDKLGIPKPPREALYPFIGPPLKEIMMAHFNLNDAQGEKALQCYREYFGVAGLFENEVYPGIPELLGELRSAGKRLILATSKPEVFTLRVLERFNLAGYFDFVAASTLDASRVHKAQVLEYALKYGGCVGSSVMVGDRKYDVEGAKVHNLPCIGVTYGYGCRTELEEAGAIATADTPQELMKLLL